jgi:hypothetical protein
LRDGDELDARRQRRRTEGERGRVDLVFGGQREVTGAERLVRGKEMRDVVRRRVDATAVGARAGVVVDRRVDIGITRAAGRERARSNVERGEYDEVAHRQYVRPKSSISMPLSSRSVCWFLQ